MSRSNKSPIFESDISLLAYYPESIFAEKLETACFRGLQNSRMKDFHDLWSMILSEKPLLTDKDSLQAALIGTFSHCVSKLSLISQTPDDDCSVLLHRKRKRGVRATLSRDGGAARPEPERQGLVTFKRTASSR